MAAQIDWKQELDKLIAAIYPSWGGVADAVKQCVHKVVARWVAGDNDELAEAVAQALADKKISEATIVKALITLVGTYAAKCPLGSGFVQQLLDDLSDKKLTAGEISELAALWAVSRTSDANLQQLIRAAADGHLSRDEIETCVLDWLKSRGQTALATALSKALAGPGPITLRGVVLLVVSFLVQKRAVSVDGTSIEKQSAAIQSAMAGLTDDELVSIIKAVVSKDYVTAARTLLSALHITADETLIKALLDGDGEAVVKWYITEQLKKLVADITADQAKSLAATIIGILKGKIELIPRHTEQQLLKMSDRDFAIWEGTRRVLYAAKLAVAGGPLVPTAAMAQPHVLAAAAITTKTPVKSLASQADWPLLLECIWLFADVEFGRHFLTPPINEDALTAGEKAYYVHRQIRDAIDG